MFKRPARLLVAALTDDGRARGVARLAQQSAFADWLEVRPAASMRTLAKEDLAWADLLIAVDPQSATAVPEQRPPTCRLSRWALPHADAPDLETAVTTTLNCMVGGMRMLARLDSETTG